MAEIPGLRAAISTVRQIYKITETIPIHKDQCIHLSDRASILRATLQEGLDKEPDNDEIRKAADEMDHILRRIHRRMSEWAALGRVKSFLKQYDIERELNVLEKDLEMVGLRFSISNSMMEVTRAQNLFRENQNHNGQLSELIRSMMTDINYNMELRNRELEAEERFREQKGLTELQQKTGILANLTGEVKRNREFSPTSGHFTDVWQGEWFGEKVAMKSLGNVGWLHEATERLVIREITILSQLQHPHVARLYGICYYKPSVYIVAPWTQGKDALSYLVAHHEADRVKLLAEAADGLAYLHSQSPPIIHGDFRAADIVISGTGKALISNFGLHKLQEVSDAQICMHFFSTDAIRWMAPELVNPELIGRSTPSPSTAADTWSFGMVSYEVFTLEKPYSHCALDVQVIDDIEQGFRHKRPRGTAETQGLTNAVWRLTEDCWEQDPLDRPGMSYVAARLKTLNKSRALRRASLGPTPTSVIAEAAYFQESINSRYPRSENGLNSLSSSPRSAHPVQEEISEIAEELGDYQIQMRRALEEVEDNPSSYRSETLTQSNCTDPIIPLVEGIGKLPFGTNASHDGISDTPPSSKVLRSGFETVPAALLTSNESPIVGSGSGSLIVTNATQTPQNPTLDVPINPADGVELQTDGTTVVAGTLEGLVYWMLVAGPLESRHMGAPYRQTFLTMYMAFTNAHTLLDVLINQYNVGRTSASLSTGQRVNLRFHVLDIIEEWIKQHRIGEVDVMILQRMKDLVSCIQDPPEIVTRARRLISDAIEPRLNDTSDISSIITFTSYDRSSISSAEPPDSDAILPQIAHQSLARNLTHIESRLYMAIGPIDIVAWVRQAGSKAVFDYQVNHQKITAWVQKLILGVRGGPQKRADKFVFFILTAHCCYTMGNFSTMSAIVLALRSTDIGRLRGTRDYVEKKYMKQLSAMAELLDFTNNFNNYRGNVTLRSAPVVPWLYVHLRDIKSTFERYPSEIQGSRTKLINFQRYERTHGKIRTALQFQSQAHIMDVEPEPGIINLLQSQLAAINLGPELDSWMELTSHECLNQESSLL
ncbi:hypothetical protein FRC03_000681 [Tulasnella sp. 419]|nr:hypothetical protein FRC03_000681 [Tulasnella sp. 419]